MLSKLISRSEQDPGEVRYRGSPAMAINKDSDISWLMVILDWCSWMDGFVLDIVWQDEAFIIHSSLRVIDTWWFAIWLLVMTHNNHRLPSETIQDIQFLNQWSRVLQKQRPYVYEFMCQDLLQGFARPTYWVISTSTASSTPTTGPPAFPWRLRFKTMLQRSVCLAAGCCRATYGCLLYRPQNGW